MIIRLFQMLKPKGLALCIIIADNDHEGSALTVVEEFNAMTLIPIYYTVEPKKGIAFARNNVLNTAKFHGITDLAFIDDDELVEVTPHNIRLRKKLLSENERSRHRKD